MTSIGAIDSGGWRARRHRRRLSSHLADSRHIVSRLAIGRDAQAIPVDGSRSGVVRRQREFFLVVVADQQLFEIGHTRPHVFGRVERIADVELLRRRRHQLHEAERPLGETADGLKPDSTCTTARTSDGRTPFSRACSTIRSS